VQVLCKLNGDERKLEKGRGKEEKKEAKTVAFVPGASLEPFRMTDHKLG